MCFTVRKINIMLSLLLVVVCSWGQVTDAKNFTITPQTVVKTNLPKQAPCLFELQDILRNVKSLIFFRPVIRPTEFFIPE